MLRDAALDLLLGSHCVGCERPGRLLCASCAGSLPGDASPVVSMRPSSSAGKPADDGACSTSSPDAARATARSAGLGPPQPPGLAQAWAAAPYDGLVRELVLGHKERRLLALRPVLGRLLAQAVTAALAERQPAPVVLVPVPSRRASVRARGHDPTRAMTGTAAAIARSGGVDAVAAPLLRLRPGVVDQAGLDAAARADNLAWSMAGRTGALRRLARRRSAAVVVVCDDVLTTGATARESQRALESLGLTVAGVAVVAATPRRRAAG